MTDDPIVTYNVVFYGSVFCRDIRPNAILDIPPELREIDIEGALEEWQPTHGGDCEGPEQSPRVVAHHWADDPDVVPAYDWGGIQDRRAMPPFGRMESDAEQASRLCPPRRHHFEGEAGDPTALCRYCGRRADDRDVGMQR